LPAPALQRRPAEMRRHPRGLPVKNPARKFWDGATTNPQSGSLACPRAASHKYALALREKRGLTLF
jgi:hypothetical protein